MAPPGECTAKTSEPITQFPSTNSSETYITTLIQLISASFEAVQGGGCKVNCYPKKLFCFFFVILYFLCFFVNFGVLMNYGGL